MYTAGIKDKQKNETNNNIKVNSCFYFNLNEHSSIAFCAVTAWSFFKTHWWACRTSSLLSADGKFHLSVHSLISFAAAQKQSRNVPKKQPRRLPFCPLPSHPPPPPLTPAGSGAKGQMTFQDWNRGSGARFSKVPIINGHGKLSPFTLKIEVSIVLHLTW